MSIRWCSLLPLFLILPIDSVFHARLACPAAMLSSLLQQAVTSSCRPWSSLAQDNKRQHDETQSDSTHASKHQVRYSTRMAALQHYSTTGQSPFEGMPVCHIRVLPVRCACWAALALQTADADSGLSRYSLSACCKRVSEQHYKIAVAWQQCFKHILPQGSGLLVSDK